MIRRNFFAPAWVLITLLSSGTWETATAAGEPTAEDVALVESLREGGYNIYFRHAETEWSQSDHVQKPGDWTSCDPEQARQLSNRGRESARLIGRSIKALGIPVERVLASPYCRTVETAQLMALGPVETTTDIINMLISHFFGGREAIVATARKRLSTAPKPGFNVVLVAHGNVAREATPAYPDEAEGIVFLPDGNGGFAVAGRLTPDAWEQLAESLGPKP